MRNGNSAADAEIAAADVLAITRGIIDAAGDRGESDPAALSQRVQQALFGSSARLRLRRHGRGNAPIDSPNLSIESEQSNFRYEMDFL